MTRGERPARHPFRDSAIFYGALAGVVVTFGLLTGNEVLQTVLVAAAFFVLATGYSWWRFRRRLGEEEGGR